MMRKGASDGFRVACGNNFGFASFVNLLFVTATLQVPATFVTVFHVCEGYNLPAANTSAGSEVVRIYQKLAISVSVV
jgi:hypothetical protein